LKVGRENLMKDLSKLENENNLLENQVEKTKK
jgi:hypothetical protein